MVTTAQLRTQIARSETAIARAKKEVKAVAYKPTKRELIERTRIERQRTEQALEKRKTGVLKEITKEEEAFKKQVAPIKAQLPAIEKAEREAKDWEIAGRYHKRDSFPWDESKGVKKKFAQLQSREISIKRLAELKEPTGIVSESIYKDVKKRAEAGEIEARRLLERIKAYVPIKEIEVPKEKITFLGRIVKPYLKAEEWARRKITYPIAEKLAAIGITAERAGMLAREISLAKVTTPIGVPLITPRLYPPTPIMIKKAEYERGFVVGAIRGVKEKPIKVAAWFGVGVAVPPAVAGIGWAARAAKIAVPLVPVTKVVAPVIKYGLPALYVGVKAKEIIAAPTPYERGYVIGAAVTTEIAPVMAGSLFGSKIATRIASKELIAEQLKKIPKKQQVEFKDYIERIKKIEQTGHPPPKEVNLKGMDRIPSKARSPIKTFIKNKGDILGGSIAYRTQTYHIKRSYTQSDVDLYTKANPISRARELAQILRNVGIKRVSTVPNTGRITIAGKKVVEFHDMVSYSQNIYQAEGFFKPVSRTITKTPEGIKVQKLAGTGLKRKLIGAYLQGRYGKDYPDFKNYLANMEKMARVTKPLPERIIKIKEVIKKAPPAVTAPPYYRYPALYKPYYAPPITPVYPYPLYPTKPTVYPIYPAVKVTPPITPYPTPMPTPTPIVYPITTKAPPYPPVKPPITIVPPYPPVKPTIYPPTIKPPVTPIPITRIEIIEAIRRKKVIKPVKRKMGWNVYGKVIKTGIYTKLNVVPLTKTQAENLGAYLTDHSLSTNWEVKSAGKPLQEPKLRIPPAYFSKTKHKFRDYRIRKGKRIPTPDHYIEKRGKPRLDTISEIKKITLLKKLAELKRKSLITKKRKARRKRAVRLLKMPVVRLKRRRTKSISWFR